MRIIIILLAAFSLSITTAVNADTFTLTSKAAANQTTLPTLYTCDGKNISPALEWNGAPNNTLSFALILSDPDAPGGVFYHWILYNIPKTIHDIAEGEETFSSGKNSWGKMNYKGPCPPIGSTHRYIFTLYALDSVLPVHSDMDSEGLKAAMKNHIIKETEFKALYGR